MFGRGPTILTPLAVAALSRAYGVGGILSFMIALLIIQEFATRPARRRGQSVPRHLAAAARIENFDLWYTPRHRDVPVYLSAVFAKGIALCGEVADGINLTRTL